MNLHEPSGPMIGFYGDDFTGSVDALLQFARHGWRGRLFTHTPTAAELTPASAADDVVGIAGIARSLPPTQMRPEVETALSAVSASGSRIVQYKASSTADSSASRGSLGAILELSHGLFAQRPVPMLFAQPDFGRYTFFGHHFAADGDVVYRLDRQPTMSRHPSTPMTESDLAAHISRQTSMEVAQIPLPLLPDLENALARSAADGVVIDAVDNDDLLRIGEALWQWSDSRPGAPIFSIGSGGLSYGLAGARPSGAHSLPRHGENTGAILAVSGSRSPRTAEQISAAKNAGWWVGDLVTTTPESLRKILRSGRSVVLDTADDLGENALELITAAGSRALGSVHDVCSRFIICGGDSSSRVLQRLGISQLTIAAHLWSNICLVKTSDGFFAGAEFLLKGGQMGDADLFEQVRTHSLER